MSWDDRDPLKAYIRQQRIVDAQLRKTLLAASNDAKRHIIGMSEGSLRRAQLELAQQQLRLWAEVGTVIDTGIYANAPAVARLNAIFTDDLLARLGVKASAEFRQGMQRAAQNSIRTYMARQQFGMTLSERVYKNGQVASGRIDSIVGNGILRGASAREIARDVAGLINPNTPGGVSYAAMRLGRTELNNSFHQANRDTYTANPFIDRVDWTLSASHPREDDCDDYADRGPYRPEDVPDKPHPQCLCFTSPRVIPQSELVSRFKSGEFDEWADSQVA